MFLLFLTSLKRFQTKIFYDNWSREKKIIGFTLIGLEKKKSHKFYDNWFGEKNNEVGSLKADEKMDIIRVRISCGNKLS